MVRLHSNIEAILLVALTLRLLSLQLSSTKHVFVTEKVAGSKIDVPVNQQGYYGNSSACQCRLD